jgi:hypothetical protein
MDNIQGIKIKFVLHDGRTAAQAVICQDPTASAQFRPKLRSNGICGGQRELMQLYSEYLGFSCRFLSTDFSIFIYHPGLVQQFTSDRSQLVSPSPFPKT